jgi:hypothetical protein
MNEQIDLTKYKRLFTFGCSFTSYMWPTWADVIAKEMPNAEFFNLGKSGSGNLLISLRIAEANNRFKFTDTDLVMVMYSSYCREDRWVDGDWISCGNIFNNDVYPKDWVKKFADEQGYLIRDAAIIDLTSTYLSTLPSTSVQMLSVPFVQGAERCDVKTEKPKELSTLYAGALSHMKPSIFDLELAGKGVDYHGFQDGHPSTIRYYNYLKKLGFSLSDSTKKFAEDATQILKEATNRNIIPYMFPEQDANITKTCRLMF